MSAHPYLPHTAEDIEKMLDVCDAQTLDDLFCDVPETIRNVEPLGFAPHSESQIRSLLENDEYPIRRLKCFAGAGFYDKYAPAAALDFLRRSEFLTSYTPYQPEVSQGTLQYIFEYQSMMAELTGLDQSNASMYDGSTATAEAMMMCVANARNRNRVLVSATVNPIVREVIDTYARYHGVEVVTIAEKDGATDADDLTAKLDKEVAGVIVASPNRYGIIEDFSGFADKTHAVKALLVINTHAAALATVKTPGEWGADIAVGEAQTLGMPLNYGGPYLGYMCVTDKLKRKMPGRIVGATKDRNGQRTFVLTLQAREQHIRREKATSNICSNQGIMTLYAAIYMSLMGAAGLEKANKMSYSRAHMLADMLVKTGRAEMVYANRPYLNEFAIELKDMTADEMLDRMARHGILAGVKLDEHRVLIAVTEKREISDIERYVELFKDLGKDE